MQSMWNEVDRRNLLNRLAKLAPNIKPLWGRMSAAETVAHLVDWGRMATGEMKVGLKKTPFRFPPLKQILLYLVPIPKNLPTVPELQKSEPGVWAEDMRELKDLIRRGVEKSRDKRAKWPPHPAFGSMSARAWGVIGYKHTDHHLRQFGV